MSVRVCDVMVFMVQTCVKHVEVVLPYMRAPLQAYGVGGMRKRQEPPAIEDRDKPYVCDSEKLLLFLFLFCTFRYKFNAVCICVRSSLWKAL